MSVVQVVQGFSKTNRWLLYTSVMLTPAQFISGIGNNCSSNIGFLAYNLYNQIIYYRAVRAKQLHALCLLAPHFNLIFAVTYFGGASSGNVYFATALALGTAGALTLNTVSAWTSWATNQPEGYGIYKFFFFGWRTLSAQWHKFMLVWQIFDSILALAMSFTVLGMIITTAFSETPQPRWHTKYLWIPLGAASTLLGLWPLILWTELIVARNHIESATDWIGVWLFIAQVGAMLVPSSSAVFGCFRRRSS